MRFRRISRGLMSGSCVRIGPEKLQLVVCSYLCQKHPALPKCLHQSIRVEGGGATVNKFQLITNVCMSNASKMRHGSFLDRTGKIGCGLQLTASSDLVGGATPLPKCLLQNILVQGEVTTVNTLQLITKVYTSCKTCGCPALFSESPEKFYAVVGSHPGATLVKVPSSPQMPFSKYTGIEVAGQLSSHYHPCHCIGKIK